MRTKYLLLDTPCQYYLRDHQGCSALYDASNLKKNRLVVDGSDNIKQINHYYPYGAIFPQTPSQPYKFCGKELDRMHGLDWYDSQARMYDPVLNRWHTQDSKAESYYSWSPYAYCAGNPVNAIDPDGKKVVFVNGYLGLGSPEGGANYWHGNNSSFVNMAKSTFKDYASPFFVNYNYKYLKSASVMRESLGYQYAKENYQSLISGMKVGEDKFNFVSHSMGGAFSEGMMKFLNEQGWETENALFLNTWEPKQLKDKTEKTRIDATCTNDPVQFLSEPVFGIPDIPLSDYKIRIKSDKPLLYRHKDLIGRNSKLLWNLVNAFLEE